MERFFCVMLTMAVVSAASAAGAAERVVRAAGYEAPDAWAVKPFHGQEMYLYGLGDEAELKALAAEPDRAIFRNVWFELADKVVADKRPLRISDVLATPSWKGKMEACRPFLNDSPTALLSLRLTDARPVASLPEKSDTHRDDYVMWTWANTRFMTFEAFDRYDTDLLTEDRTDLRARLDRDYEKLRLYHFHSDRFTGSWSDLPMMGFNYGRKGLAYLRYRAKASVSDGLYARGASRQFNIPFGWCAANKTDLAYGAFIGCSSLALADGSPLDHAADLERLFTWTYATDRGKAFTPVALLVPLESREKSTFETLLAGGSFGELADVVAPDAGQTDEEISAALSRYPAAILTGACDRRYLRPAVLDRYVRAGGTLFCPPEQLADGTVSLPVGDCGKGRVVALGARAARTDDAARKVLATLRDELLPVTVAGDVRWGVNRTKSGWLVWLVNGRTAPSDVSVTLKTTGEGKTATVPSGDWKVLSFADAPARPKPREILLTDWEFSRDNKTWTKVSVPHDWAIGEPFDINADAQVVAVVQDGESEMSRRIGRTGALPWIGHGWYRRHITLPDGVREAELWFDGAMANAEVFANGEPAGGRNYGYVPFTVKLPKAREIDVVVHLMTLPQSSRWYPGAGLYRAVTLRLDPQYRVEDVFVRTEKIEGGRAYLRVSGPDGERTFTVDNPRLWTPEDPYLYTLEPEGIRYGIRTVEWKDGTFRLNGKVRKFNGVCLHHDLGPIGTAFNPAAFRRQVRLLKEIGCDAIRTAHNIPCSEQMDICDEMGMMVMAESFDEWRQRKCKYGYHVDFDDWWRADLESLVRFHRNHPSIVMWSIGNEIPDQMTTEGADLSRAMIGLLHWFDPSRPVTQGHSAMPYAIEKGGVQAMDIPGVTYRLRFYGDLHAASKYGGVLGAETASTMSSRGWYAFPDEYATDREYLDAMQSSSYDLECGSWSNLPDDDFATQDDNAWTLGEFVWTGFDYLGEPAPYDDRRSRSSYFGIYDLAGLPKDRAYLYRARWRRDVPTLHVLPHWTWPERVGQKTPVYVYTSYPAAELFVNGKSLGRKAFDKTSRLDRYRLRWRDVVYEPGELKVVAYGADGQPAATKVVRTAGAPHHLVLTPDRTRLAGARDLAFVTVDVVDKGGNLCPRAANRVNFTVTGAGSFKAACNGDATDLDTLSKPTMRAFNGRLVAIVAPGPSAGKVTLTAETPGLPPVSVTLDCAIRR